MQSVYLGWTPGVSARGLGIAALLAATLLITGACGVSTDRCYPFLSLEQNKLVSQKSDDAARYYMRKVKRDLIRQGVPEAELRGVQNVDLGTSISRVVAMGMARKEPRQLREFSEFIIAGKWEDARVALQGLHEVCAKDPVADKAIGIYVTGGLALISMGDDDRTIKYCRYFLKNYPAPKHLAEAFNKVIALSQNHKKAQDRKATGK